MMDMEMHVIIPVSVSHETLDHVDPLYEHVNQESRNVLMDFGMVSVEMTYDQYQNEQHVTG